MAFWSGVKRLFGAGIDPKDLLDKDNGLLAQAGGWIGNMNFTEQERAEYAAKAADGVVEYVKMTLSENTTRSKTRRVIAISWILTELFFVTLTVVVWPMYKAWAEFIWKVATSDVMMWGTLSVLAFFFGPYMIGKHFQRQGK